MFQFSRDIGTPHVHFKILILATVVIWSVTPSSVLHIFSVGCHDKSGKWKILELSQVKSDFSYFPRILRIDQIRWSFENVCFVIAFRKSYQKLLESSKSDLFKVCQCPIYLLHINTCRTRYCSNIGNLKDTSEPRSESNGTIEQVLECTYFELIN